MTDPQPPVSDQQYQMGVERATDAVLNTYILFGEVRGKAIPLSPSDIREIVSTAIMAYEQSATTPGGES